MGLFERAMGTEPSKEEQRRSVEASEEIRLRRLKLLDRAAWEREMANRQKVVDLPKLPPPCNESKRGASNQMLIHCKGVSGRRPTAVLILTVDDVADLLGCHKTTIFRMLSDGRLPKEPLEVIKYLYERLFIKEGEGDGQPPNHLPPGLGPMNPES